MRVVKVLCLLGVLGALDVFGGSGPVAGQAGRPAKSALEISLEMRRAQMPNDGEIHVLPVQGNVSMLLGAGGHDAVHASAWGDMFVDIGTAQMSDKLLAAIKTLSVRRYGHVINTHFPADHIGGNELFSKAGSMTGGGVAEI